VKYWHRTDTGALVAPFTVAPRTGYSHFALTDDVADLPGPLEVCKWNGTAIVVDASIVPDLKARLRRAVEEKALADVQAATLSTPWGDFRVRRDDLDLYTLIGFRALYAIQTSETWSIAIRRADDSTATLTAVQFVRLLALMGDRIATRLGQRDTKLDQLAAATASDLKGFAP
jgi:hypothetical protein